MIGMGQKLAQVMVGLKNMKLTPPQNKLSKVKVKTKPLLCLTNQMSFCYDCQDLLTENDQKGTGIGLTGISLYFCEKCYLDRFDHGDGEVVDFSEDFSLETVTQVRDEYYQRDDRGCLKCRRVGIKLFGIKGIFNQKLKACRGCYRLLAIQINHGRTELTAEDLEMIRDEMGYQKRIQEELRD